MFNWNKEVKFLGITLDTKLLWNKLIMCRGHFAQPLMVCRCLAKTNWGCTPITLLVSVTWTKRVQIAVTRKALAKVQCPGLSVHHWRYPFMHNGYRSLALCPLHLVVERNVAFAAISIMGKRPDTLPAILKLLPMAAAHVWVRKDNMSQKYNFEKKFANMKEWSNEPCKSVKHISSDGMREGSGQAQSTTA